MLRQLNDFQEAYAQQIEGTLRVLAMLTDKNLTQTVAAEHRTLGQIAWHIVTSVPEMMQRTGLSLSAVDHDSPPPMSAAEILAGYRTVTDELMAALTANWDDATLLQTDDMYGKEWSRGLTLSVLMQHEIHHRGQMTVLLRQAGARVPGIYGPSKEEWASYGMEAPPY